MATVAELISQVLRRLDELSTTTPVHWTRDEILVFVNEALTEYNLITWEFQGTVTKTINTADNVYDQPVGMFSAITMRAPNYLRRQTADDIDREVKWDSDSEKHLHVRTWAPLGMNKFLIHPRPLGNITAYIEGLIEHTPVTDGAWPLPVRPEYESAIEDFCVERAQFKEGPSELEQAGRHYKSFIDVVQQSSGRNVIRMYPRYSSGIIAEDNLRDRVAGNDNPT
jgi:hypothetical protein